MSKAVTVWEAADQLGMTPGMVRNRLKKGELKGRKVKANRGQGYEWRVILNGDEPVPELKPVPKEGEVDPLTSIAEEFIALGKRLKRAIKYHDERVRQKAITDFATTLAETVQKGR